MPEVAMKRKTTGWTTVGLGDVAINSTVATQTPEEDGFTRYIIGKHIPGDGGRITTWGDVGDGEFGSRIRTVIKPGDIVCTTRGPKLRVAVATFDCLSAHTNFVLRTSDAGVMLQEYLQALACSDGFQEHLRRNFRGSTNLFVNWSDAARFEFALPPIEEQRRIVSALKSAAGCQGAHLATADMAAVAQEALVENRMRGLSTGSMRRHERVGRYCGAWKVIRLGELVTMAQYGLSDIATDTGRFPMLRMMNLESGRAVENDLKYIDLNPAEHLRYRLANGDVLFNRTNSYDLVGRTGVYDLGGDHVFASYLVRLRTDGARLNPAYLCAFLNAPVGRRQVMSFATRGVSQTNVNATSLRRVLMPLPPIEYQLRTIAALRSLTDASDSARSRAAEAGRMIARIINAELTR